MDISVSYNYHGNVLDLEIIAVLPTPWLDERLFEESLFTIISYSHFWNVQF